MYPGDNYVACEKCGDIGSWVPASERTGWRCIACRIGTRFGSREELLIAADEASSKYAKACAVEILSRVIMLGFAAYMIFILVRHH